MPAQWAFARLTSLDMDELVTEGRGSLQIGYAESMSFLQTKNADKSFLRSRPDMELIFFPADFSLDGGTMFRASWHVSQELYDSYFKQHEGKNVFMVIPMHLQPKSMGNLTIKSKNINDPPVMHYPFLSAPEDVRAFIDAIRYAIDATKEGPMAQYGVKPVSTVFPQCKQYRFHSDEYWECALRTISITLHHQVATSRMGPRSDPLAVVNQRGQVHGVKHLRVADPSILPLSISAHTTLPSYMIGEKIALDIKKKYVINRYLQ